MHNQKINLEKQTQIIQQILLEYETDDFTPLSHKHSELFDNQLYLIIPIIKLLIQATENISSKSANKKISRKQNACLSFLQHILFEIRYKTDFNEPFAIKCSHEGQGYLATNLHLFSVPVINEILRLFHEAKLDITEELKEAIIQEKSKKIEANHRDISINMEELDTILETMIDQIQKDSKIENDFEWCNLFMQENTVFPKEKQILIIAGLFNQSNTNVQEVVPLMLLSQEKDIRTDVIQILASSPESISGKGLRRLITLRNWLPYEEQNALDHLIEKTREAGVECAPHPQTVIKNLLSCAFDGSGVQLMLAHVKQRLKKKLSGFLLKDHIGIREPWFVPKPTLFDYKQLVKQINENPETKLFAVKEEYAEKIIPHYLAFGRENHRIPELDALQLAELFGKNWIPKLLDIRTELDQLKETVKPETWNPEMMEQHLERGLSFLKKEKTIDSWFECGERVNKVLDDSRCQVLKDLDNLTDRDFSNLSAKIFEPVRNVWLNKMFCMTLWYFFQLKKNDHWIHFLALTEEILKGKELIDIPHFQFMLIKTIGVQMHNLTFDYR